MGKSRLFGTWVLAILSPLRSRSCGLGHSCAGGAWQWLAVVRRPAAPEHRLEINLAILSFVRKYSGVGIGGPAMDTRRSYYLQSNQDDFSDAEPCQFDTSDVPYVTPANDNAPTKVRLSARCGALLRRLIALHRLSRPVT